jgi:hypothetical protein
MYIIEVDGIVGRTILLVTNLKVNYGRVTCGRFAISRSLVWQVSACITEDSDLLAFGCGRVTQTETNADTDTSKMNTGSHHTSTRLVLEVKSLRLLVLGVDHAGCACAYRTLYDALAWDCHRKHAIFSCCCCCCVCVCMCLCVCLCGIRFFDIMICYPLRAFVFSCACAVLFVCVLCVCVCVRMCVYVCVYAVCSCSSKWTGTCTQTHTHTSTHTNAHSHTHTQQAQQAHNTHATNAPIHIHIHIH